MEIELSFASRVLRLNRYGFSLVEIADITGETESAVMEAHRMLGIGLVGESIEAGPKMSEEARAKLRDTMPRKMQDRMKRIAAERKNKHYDGD